MKFLTASFLHTVMSRAVDRSTNQFWNFLAKGHSIYASNFPSPSENVLLTKTGFCFFLDHYFFKSIIFLGPSDPNFLAPKNSLLDKLPTVRRLLLLSFSFTLLLLVLCLQRDDGATTRIAGQPQARRISLINGWDQ